MELRFHGIRLRNTFYGDPYISKDKSYDIAGAQVFTGRILEAEALTMCITDMDYRIIKDTYRWESAEVIACYKSRKGPLPQCIRDFIIEAYRFKTSLKGIPGELNETLYNKSKNRINGIYGLMATNPIRKGIEYMCEDRDFHFDEHTSVEELFEKAQKSYWLPYQFGIWCTANARFELYRCARLASHAGDQSGRQDQESENGFHDFVYCDTDSVKYIGEVDFSEYNAEKIRLSTESGAFAVDAKGKTHYMGALENDGFYLDFKSAGPKKYAYIEETKTGDRELHVTIAGVEKKKGAIELEKRGGLEALRDGFVFREAGGLAARYNDFPEVTEIVKDGEKIEITANIYLYQSEYTVGTLEEYKRIIRMSHILFDKIIKEVYNEINGENTVN